MKVELATSQAQIDQVHALRYRVYCEEKHLDFEEADHDALRLVDPGDSSAHVWLAYEGDVPVGTVRLLWGGDEPFDEGIERNFSVGRFVEIVGLERIAVFGRFMILPEHRSGLASALLLHAVADFGFARGVDVGLCDCEPHLVAFYESIGFRPYGRVFNDPVFGLKVPLVLLASDRAHLAAIGSFVGSMIPATIRSTPEPALLELLPSGHDGGGIGDVSQIAAMFARVEGRDDRFIDQLDPDDVGALCEKATVVEFAPGDVLIREGHVSRTMWLLLNGTVEVVHNGRVRAVRTAGDIVGEFAMLLDGPRTAEVGAVEAGRALVLSDRTVRRLMTDEPELAARFLFQLAAHLGRCLLAS